MVKKFWVILCIKGKMAKQKDLLPKQNVLTKCTETYYLNILLL